MDKLFPGDLLVSRPSDPEGAAGEAVRGLRFAAAAIAKTAAEKELTALEILAIDVAVTHLVRAHQHYRRTLWWGNEADETNAH